MNSAAVFGKPWLEASDLELSPLSIAESRLHIQRNLTWTHSVRGGFPDSYLATDDAASWRWRDDFISPMGRELR